MDVHTAKAKAAYQDFLTLWKDADPDAPVFGQAKAEDAKKYRAKACLIRRLAIHCRERS